jgi:hypothetical protein
LCLVRKRSMFVLPYGVRQNIMPEGSWSVFLFGCGSAALWTPCRGDDGLQSRI